MLGCKGCWCLSAITFEPLLMFCCCCCARSELLPAGETATAVMGIDFCDSTQAANFQLWWVSLSNAPFLHSSKVANERIQSCVWSSLQAKFLFLPVLSASFSTHTRKFFVSIQPPVGELMRPVFLTENEFKKEQGEWWKEWKYDEKITRWASLLFVFLSIFLIFPFILTFIIDLFWAAPYSFTGTKSRATWQNQLAGVQSWCWLWVKHPQYNIIIVNTSQCNIIAMWLILQCTMWLLSFHQPTLSEHCETVSTWHLLVDWKVNGVDYFLKTKLLDKKKKNRYLMGFNG